VKSFFFVPNPLSKPKHTPPGEADGAGALSALEAESARRRLDFVLNTIHEGVLAADAGLTLQAANPQARNLFGIAPSFCLGRGGKSVSLLEATRSTGLEALALEALAQGAALAKEMKFYSAGAERHFLVSAAPFAGSDDERWALALVFEERTRLRTLERVRKDFAANVSHELRTPIQVVKGFAETLLESPLADAARQGIEIILKNALSMEALTADLLCLMALEEGGAPPFGGAEETPVRPLLEEALAAVEMPAQDKGITLSLACPAELSAFLYRRLMIRGVANLLDNAVKYSPPGSRVRLAAVQEAERLVITVQDQGIGIPAQHLPRIFERFYRVGSGRCRGQGGAGLGLAIVRHIAQVHHGAAAAESHAGEGSVFTLWVPVRGSGAPPPAGL
jgi:two-component system phosphate regulon sensor histidine kinase PhoR